MVVMFQLAREEKKFCEEYPRRSTASLKNPKNDEYFFNIDAKLAQTDLHGRC